MKPVIAKFLRRVGLLRFDLLAYTVPSHPEKGALRPGEVAIVRDGGLLKWACMTCPGGCGATIALSLNPDRRPRWRIVADWWGRPSVEPSVHQTNACGCHFWIRDGRVEWCADGRPRRPRT